MCALTSEINVSIIELFSVRYNRVVLLIKRVPATIRVMRFLLVGTRENITYYVSEHPRTVAAYLGIPMRGYTWCAG